MWAYRPKLRPAEIHPALHSFADECTAVIGRLLAYVGALALVAIAGNRILADLPAFWEGAAPASRPGWSLTAHSHPAFAVTQVDSSLKTETYDIFRHPEGGRKDIIGWATASNQKPVAELELYRPGTEAREDGPAITGITLRMDPDERRDVESAGVIDSKSGRTASDPARGDQLHAGPPDPADGRKRPQTGGIVRPCRTETRRLQSWGGIDRIGRLGDQPAKSPAARQPLGRVSPKRWIRCNILSSPALFSPGVARLALWRLPGGR